MKPKIQRKDVTKQVLKDSKPKDFNREAILKKARKKAHSVVADLKREMSNDIKN